MHHRSPSSPPPAAASPGAEGDPAARIAAVFLDSLARSPQPRPRLPDAARLLRRAPLIDRLARRRARARRLLGPALTLEALAAAGAVITLWVAGRGPSFANLRRLVDVDVGLRLDLAPATLTLAASAALLLWWLCGSGPARAR